MSQTLLAAAWQVPPESVLSSPSPFPLQAGLFCCTEPHCGLNQRQDPASLPVLKAVFYRCYVLLNSHLTWHVSRAPLPFTSPIWVSDTRRRKKDSAEPRSRVIPDIFQLINDLIEWIKTPNLLKALLLSPFCPSPGLAGHIKSSYIT